MTWGSEHLPEISFGVTRWDAQSNDRAELEAMLCAMLSTNPSVAVMTDDEWVSKGVNLLLEARNDCRNSMDRTVRFGGDPETSSGTTSWMTVRHVDGHASVTVLRTNCQ